MTTDLPDEPAAESAGITPAVAAETESQPFWARRTVLKAAALDTPATPAVRAAALRPLGAAASSGPDALTRAIDAFASVTVGSVPPRP